MKTIAIDIAGIEYGDFILGSLVENGCMPEWADKSSVEKLIGKMRQAMSPEDKLDGFRKVFDYIGAMTEDALKYDELPIWLKDFEVCVYDGPLNYLINYVSNVYPDVPKEVLGEAIRPYMVAVHSQEYIKSVWEQVREIIKDSASVKAGIDTFTEVFYTVASKVGDIESEQIEIAVMVIDSRQFMRRCKGCMAMVLNELNGVGG